MEFRGGDGRLIHGVKLSEMCTVGGYSGASFPVLQGTFFIGYILSKGKMQSLNSDFHIFGRDFAIVNE